MIHIHFHKLLQKYTNKEDHYLDIDNLTNLLNALRELFPNLFNTKTKDIFTILYDKKHIVPNTWFLKNSFPIKITNLYLVPCIYGTGNTAGKIAIGIALIAMSFIPGVQGFAISNLLEAGALSEAIFGIGINLIIGGILETLMKVPEPVSASVDDNIRINNDVFDGLQNSVDSSQLLSLNYGLVRIPGQFISGYVKTIGHGQDDIIQVGNLF